MDILAITLRQEYSKTANISYSSKKGVEVKELNKLPSVLSYVENNQSKELYEFFARISQSVDPETEVYITIPTRLVNLKCSVRENTKAEKDEKKLLCKVLRLEKEHLDTFYLSKIYENRQKETLAVSACAVLKNHIEIIVDAANQAGLNIRHIEPESIAALKFINNLNLSCAILEVEEKSTTITGYSPLKGVFSMTLSSMTWKDITSADGELALFDVSANDTFKGFDIPAPLYILSDKRLEVIEAFTQAESSYLDRITYFEVPSAVFSKQSSLAAMSDYASTIGLAIKPLTEGRNTSERQSISYKLNTFREIGKERLFKNIFQNKESS